MYICSLKEKSSQRVNLIQSLRDEKNRRFVSWAAKEAM